MNSAFADLGEAIEVSENWRFNHPVAMFALRALEMCNFVCNHELFQEYRLRLVCIDSPRIQGRCALDGQVGVVGFTSGAVECFSHMFALLMSDPHIFPHVGNSGKEISRPLPAYLPTRADNIAEEFFHVPNCAVRAAFSIELTQMATSNLIAHELNHIEQGHINYLRRNASASAVKFNALDEVNASIATGDSSESQVLELISDLHAVFRLLRRAVSMREFLLGRVEINDPVFTALSRIYLRSEESFYFTLFAVFMSWRLFDVQFWDESKLSSMSHPPIPARQLALIFGVVNRLERYLPGFTVEKGRAHFLGMQALGAAHHAYLRLTGGENDDRATQGMALLNPDRKSLRYVWDLIERMDGVELELRPFAWGWPGVHRNTRGG